MTITNKTLVTLYCEGQPIAPNETKTFMEHCFDTTSVHSSIGSCEITTEYSQRTFHNWGNIYANELDEKGEDGLKKVEILEIS